MKTVSVLIPAYNEEESIGRVIQDIPRHLVKDIIVIDNNSTDRTSDVARRSGAIVIAQPERGYGNACLKGIEFLRSEPPDIVVFLDGDYSDYPEEMEDLVKPLLNNEADLVIGSRTLGRSESGALALHQKFGNLLATILLHLLYGRKFTDLGPFRAISYSALMQLGMTDRTYGWTVEMQVKAVKKKLRTVEIPVRYRNRIGRSKISGTLKGSVLAGYKILTTIGKHL